MTAFFKVTALPPKLKAGAIYAVAPASSPNVELYIVNKKGTNAKRVGLSDELLKLLLKPLPFVVTDYAESASHYYFGGTYDNKYRINRFTKSGKYEKAVAYGRWANRETLNYEVTQNVV